MRKTSAMVEAGILAAVAIVMALIAIYIPFPGIFLLLVWSVPIITCDIRNGLKWSILTTIVAGLICAMLINPLQAFILVAVFGILGIILGECMRRNSSPLTILTYGTLGGILALTINFAIAFLILNINPIDMLFKSFDNSLIQMTEFLRSIKTEEIKIAAIIASYKELINMMRMVIPAALLMTAPTLSFINYFVAKKMLSRFGNHFEDIPPFRNLIIPSWVLLPFWISLVTINFSFEYYGEKHLLTQLLINIQYLTAGIFTLQGIALASWYIYIKNKPSHWIYFFLLFPLIPFGSYIMLWIGAFDCIADFRKIRGVKIGQ